MIRLLTHIKSVGSVPTVVPSNLHLRAVIQCFSNSTATPHASNDSAFNDDDDDIATVAAYAAETDADLKRKRMLRKIKRFLSASDGITQVEPDRSQG